MKIYTRTGDDGQTDTGRGRRVAKDAVEMEVVGTIDELNSLLGVVRAERLPEPLATILSQIQSDLFLLDAEIVGPSHSPRGIEPVTDEDVRRLESQIDRLDADLPRLRHFVLPGGAPTAAFVHLARAVCRRAERCLVALLRENPAAARPVTLAYLNRLSDLLFVLARAANAEAGVDEPIWPPPAADEKQ